MKRPEVSENLLVQTKVSDNLVDGDIMFVHSENEKEIIVSMDSWDRPRTWTKDRMKLSKQLTNIDLRFVWL